MKLHLKTFIKSETKKIETFKQIKNTLILKQTKKKKHFKIPKTKQQKF